MGGIVKSVGGFLGLGSGEDVPTQTGNSFLDQLKQPGLQGYIDPGKGSNIASDWVQHDGILGQLFGQGGELSKAIGKEQELQNQGFQLTPEDHTMYGQVSGDIARLFGQQENAAANDLAMRGLAAAPSGAAGATFSGLAGNKNEMLAKAQQQIMQNRFENTMKQISQQQQFVSSLGAQGANAINQQYGRQQEGWNGILNAANVQNAANNGANNANLAAAQFKHDTTPANFMDYTTAGVGSSLYNIGAAPGNLAQSASGAAGKSIGGGLFSKG